MLETNELIAALAAADELTDEKLRELRESLLHAAVARETAVYAPLMQFACSKMFIEKVAGDDWLMVNLHRILAAVATADNYEQIAEAAANPEYDKLILEQFALCLNFLWAEKLINDEDAVRYYTNIYEKHTAANVLWERVAMAVMFNAAVIGTKESTELTNKLIYSGVFVGESAPMTKAAKAILAQPAHFREMFYKQHIGLLTDEAEELKHIHEPVVEEKLQLPSKGKPIVRESPKVGRNDPCPCGSGLKYKKCCGK